MTTKLIIQILIFITSIDSTCIKFLPLRCTSLSWGNIPSEERQLCFQATKVGIACELIFLRATRGARRLILVSDTLLLYSEVFLRSVHLLVMPV